VGVPSEGFLGDEANEREALERIRKVTTVSHLKQHCKTFWIGPKERKCSVYKQTVTEYSPTPSAGNVITRWQVI
jgi:hypothetical protein